MTRRRVKRMACVMAALATAAPGVVAAQGGFGRGKGAYGRGALPRAPGVEIPQIVNPVNLLIEHRPQLALSDSQFRKVIAIKRALDSTNAPLERKLDSVQRLFRNGPLFTNGSTARRDSLAEARALVAQVAADIQDNMASARDRAHALLSSRQLDDARALEAAAEQSARDAELRKEGRSGAGKPPPA